MMRTTSFLIADALAARRNRRAAYEAAFEQLENNHIPGELAERSWRFYANINLYVDMTAQCNAACPFCINRVEFLRDDIDDGAYLSRLDRALECIEHLGPSLQILGGEPTLDRFRERLFGILRLAGKYNVRKVVVGSNGSGFRDRSLADRLAPTLAHLNVSRHHYEDGPAREVFHASEALSAVDLRALLGSGLANKVRLNCGLLSGYVDSCSEVVRYLDWATSMGCRNVCFASLSDLPSGYIHSDSQIARVRSLRCDFDEVLAGISEDPRFRFLKFHSGTHCMYEVWNYSAEGRSCTVVFATSDNHFARKLDEAADLVELLVFHTNGQLNASWNRHAKTVLAFSSADAPGGD